MSIVMAAIPIEKGNGVKLLQMTSNSFQKWLQEELHKRGWSQGELARRASISQSAISHVLNGMRAPGPDFCRAVARALGLDECFVFWKAGLIRKPPQPLDPEAQKALALFRALPPEDRRLALEFLEFLQTRHAAKRGRP